MFGDHFGRQCAVIRATTLSEVDHYASETDNWSGRSPVWAAGQSGVLIKIEQFVTRVLRSTPPAFILNWNGAGGPEVVDASIGRRRRDVRRYSNEMLVIQQALDLE